MLPNADRILLYCIPDVLLVPPFFVFIESTTPPLAAGLPHICSNYGLSALRQAVVVEDKEKDTRRSRAERGGGGSGDGEGTAVVRYTGLVGAIDAYLEAFMRYDKSEAASRLGVAGAGVEDEVADQGGGEGDGLGGRRQQGIASEGRRAASPSQHQQQHHHHQHHHQHHQQDHPPPRSAKKTILVGVDSPNTVARAARGWENDAPVIPAGMRHFPQKSCTVAGLVGNGGFGGRAVALDGGSKGSEVNFDIICWLALHPPI